MKKVAICYKGIFGGKRISNSGFQEQILIDSRKNIKDHKEKFSSQFEKFGYSVDYYMSTYHLSDKLDMVYHEELNPKHYSYISDLFLSEDHYRVYGSWAAQFTHFKNLISLIRKENVNYDLLVFTRPDLKFHWDLDQIYPNLDLDKFNIPVQHLSGNCDDNLFIFPGKYLNEFEQVIDTLLSRNGITHEINHGLNERQVPIKWICSYVYENTEFGHNMFSFFR
jgi:hypothetical protein